jgi:hypothetical protein
MRRLSIIALGVTFILIFCGSNAISGWQQKIGKEVVFVEKDSSGQKYGYILIYREPNIIGNRLPYKDFVGKKGKLIGVVKDKLGVAFFWEIQLETGQMAYAQKLEGFDDQIDDLYFVDDYNEAKKKIGKFIWVNQNEWKQPLLTENKDLSYPLEDFEKVKVIDVFTKLLGHAYGGAPFYLKVQKNTGEIGYIGYQHNNYFDENPIDPTWDKSIIEAIKQHKITIGMTNDQVQLSWGKPKKVNRTVTSQGVREQWIYSKEKYLYLDNNKLTAIQEEL